MGVIAGFLLGLMYSLCHMALFLECYVSELGIYLPILKSQLLNSRS